MAHKDSYARQRTRRTAHMLGTSLEGTHARTKLVQWPTCLVGAHSEWRKPGKRTTSPKEHACLDRTNSERCTHRTSYTPCVAHSGRRSPRTTHIPGSADPDRAYSGRNTPQMAHSPGDAYVGWAIARTAHSRATHIPERSRVPPCTDCRSQCLY